MGVLNIPILDGNMEITYKGYIIKPHRQVPTSFCVATAGQGGKIPAVLEGLFTSVGIAKNVIDAYIDTKEVKNGKTNRQSRD